MVEKRDDDIHLSDIYSDKRHFVKMRENNGSVAMDHRVISHSRFHHFENFKSRFRMLYNFSLCKVVRPIRSTYIFIS